MSFPPAINTVGNPNERMTTTKRKRSVVTRAPALLSALFPAPDSCVPPSTRAPQPLVFFSRMNPTIPVDAGLLGHARCGHDIWGVYNGNPTMLLNMPTREQAPAPYHASVKGNFSSPSYVSLASPYIMFIPTFDPWYGPILGRLHYKRSSLSIVQRGDGRWILDAEVASEWHTLELRLRGVLHAMMTVSKLPRPKGMVPFGYPYRFGYFWHYATENAARAVAFRSINGFLPLIGNLAMMFWYMQINANAQPEWRDCYIRAASL
ncbi:hypothetical protein B0H11DRAFT_2238837 [Mycena galericulata]|nr:hypothetical protein B0H11DRAFT_2238837 [Mycena galericulata]